MFIIKWIKGLFAHPKTTVSGVGALAGAAAIGYGMSKGTIPIDAQSIATAGGLASAGLVGVLGKDADPIKLVDAALTAAPAVDLVQQYQALTSEAKDAQQKLEAFQKVTDALSKALPQ